MKANSLIVISICFLALACSPQHFKEEDKVLHAGPSVSGLGVIYFALYTENRYMFCDGDFMDDGCYQGHYSLSRDTIILIGLKKYPSIPSNRFLIRRYKDMDSTYWQWKYPKFKDAWKEMRHADSLKGSEGDILKLDRNNRIVFDENNYFLIRFDKLKYRH